MSDDLIKRLLDWSEHDEGKINDARQEAADRIEQLEESNKELTLQLLATSGQAADALDKLAKAVEALRWAYGTLKEINPSNYTHDDACSLNDASVEVVIGIRAVLAELEGEK